MAEQNNNKKKNSFVDDLKVEWNLFWEGLVGDDENAATQDKEQDPFLSGKLELLSLEQVKALTKALSADRKKLNQRLESLVKEIDLNSAKLESLKLVGGSSEDTLVRLNELHDLGQSINEQLDKINSRLKMARRREEALKKAALRDL